MTKNSSCSCPQTCKLITSWVNSVKTADFQSTPVSPASTPSRYAANKWEGPLFTNCPAFNETSVFMVLAYTWSQFCISQMLFCFPAAVPRQPGRAHLLAVTVLQGNAARWQSSCPAEFVPPFLGQKHVNHSHTGLATNYAGLKDFTSMPGQCEEEHLWRQVQAQSAAWLLAFIESCSLPTHKSWDGDIHQPVLQGGLHQSVMSNLGVHLWSKLCLEKERLPRFLLWVCWPRHGVDTWLHMGDKTQQPFPCLLCP